MNLERSHGRPGQELVSGVAGAAPTRDLAKGDDREMVRGIGGRGPTGGNLGGPWNRGVS